MSTSSGSPAPPTQPSGRTPRRSRLARIAAGLTRLQKALIALTGVVTAAAALIAAILGPFGSHTSAASSTPPGHPAKEYLASLAPSGTSPGLGLHVGTAEVEGTPMPNSLTFSCGTALSSVAYGTNGYPYVHVLVGLSDTAPNPAKHVAHLSFFKDNDSTPLKSIVVRPGPAMGFLLDLHHASTIRVMCRTDEGALDVAAAPFYAPR
jgi:hypothetical protein